MPVQLTARNATLDDLAALLKDQRARAIDLVAPASQIGMRDGALIVSGAPQVLEDSGVTDPNGTYRPTVVGDEGLAEKLSIHGKYYRQLRDAGRTDLLDANVNGMLHGRVRVAGGERTTVHPPLDARLLLRLLRDDVAGTGVCRAVVSERFGLIDHLDVLVAALAGVRDSGMATEVTECNLSERNMYVTIEAPELVVQATKLLEGYRDPFRKGGIDRIRRMARYQVTDPRPGQRPIRAGFRITNSESGDGKFRLIPFMRVLVCNNGQTISSDAIEQVHLGGRLEQGIVQWSDATRRKATELVVSKTGDAVRTFLTQDYWTRAIAAMEADADQPLADAAKTITHVRKRSLFPAAMEDDILAAFTAGGQLTAAGVMHALTAAAQMTDDVELAARLEANAIPALHAAAAFARQ